MRAGSRIFRGKTGSWAGVMSGAENSDFYVTVWLVMACIASLFLICG
jgi:hypothetical protein